MKESAVLADMGYLNVKDFKFEDDEICSDNKSNKMMMETIKYDL